MDTLKPEPQAPDGSSEVSVREDDCPACFAHNESRGLEHGPTWMTRWRPGSGVFGMGRYYQKCHSCGYVLQIQLWS